MNETFNFALQKLELVVKNYFPHTQNWMHDYG